MRAGNLLLVNDSEKLLSDVKNQPSLRRRGQLGAEADYKARNHVPKPFVPILPNLAFLFRRGRSRCRSARIQIRGKIITTAVIARIIIS